MPDPKKGRYLADDCYRSLLQKAVRRGHPELVYTASAFLEAQRLRSAEWFKERAACILFGECWPLGREVVFTRSLASKVAALVRIARTQKVRDAAGLGLLGYALAHGDAGVLDGAPDQRSVKLIAKAVQHPAGFWEWVFNHSAGPESQSLAARASRYREGGRPHDKAVVQAAAYLAVSGTVPNPAAAPEADDAFPFWVVFDRHTAEGRRALRDVARDLRIVPAQLEWCFYYFEGSAANRETASDWWRHYCGWRFRRLGMLEEEARLLWEPAKAQVKEALADDSRRLQAEIYRWRLAHRATVAELKLEVEHFTSRIKEVPRDQPHLF